MRVHLTTLFIVLLGLSAVLSKPLSHPLIQQPAFTHLSTTSLGIKGRLSPGSVADPENKLIYFSFGYSPAYLVKYNTFTSQVVEWVTVNSDLRGCVLRVWKGHLIVIMVNERDVTIIKYDSKSLLSEENTQKLGPFPVFEDVYGKLDMAPSGEDLIVTLAPIQDKQQKQRTQVAIISLEKFTLTKPFLSVGGSSYHGCYYGSNQTHIFVGGLGSDLTAPGKIWFINIEQWKIQSSSMLSNEYFPRNSIFNMDVSVQETPDQVVITECTDKFSIKIVDKLFTNVQTFTPTFDLSPIGVRRCEAVLHTPTSGLLGYTSSNSSVTLTQFDISTGSFNIVKRTKITNVYSSDCDGLLKPHIFNDTMYVTSSVCDITERGNLKIFLVRMHGTTVCVMEHPSVLSTLPLMIAPFPRGNFPNGARNENYLLVASKHGLVSKLKYTDDGLTVSVVGAYKLPNPLLAGEGDPVRSRIYFKDTTNTVMELDVMTLNLVTKNVIPNNMIVKACVTSAKHGRITMVVMDTGTGDYRLVNYDVVNMAEIATTDAIPALRDAEGISSFILDDDEVNGYFIRSCSQGKTLVHIYLPDLQVKATYLWDTDFVAVAQNPVISGNYLFYSTSHLAQTTEYLRFDLKTTPNFTTQTALAPFRYIPRVMTLDPSQPNVVYVAMDSVVKQMSISSSSWFEKGREMRFSELDYAPGGVFTSSVIDRQNNLLFLASSNGLVFTVNINEETTMAFKIGMGCAGAALGAFVLMLISLLIARNAYRLRRLKNRESEMERLLEERLLVDDETTSCEPQHSWIIDYSELQIDDRISEGTFGVIFKGRLRGMVVAIKKLKADGDEDAFHQEAKILASLRHPNTVLFMGISLTTNYNFMVTEFCSGGSLEDFIHKKKRLRKPISFKKKVKLLFGVVNGMMYLHNMKNPQNPLESKPLIHRDLKPSNILLDDTRTVAKVCDFGASKILSANATMTGRIGTILYMSPEVLMNQRYTESCDVYSFGIIMHEIFYERVPYSTPQSSINGSNTSSTSSEGSSAEFANLWTLGLQISQGLRPFVPEENSKEFMAYSKHQQHYLRVMQLCWDSVPSNRPTFCDLADVFAKWM